MSKLSSGQKTSVFLSGIKVHEPDIVLLDEPSNHLDAIGRNLLYEYISATPDTLVVVSHDRTLLRLLNTVYELSKHGLTLYGGNYDFYAEQKKTGLAALNQDLRNKEKTLRKAKETERESLERQQKLDARGKKKQEKAGLPTILMNTLRNNAERSTSRTRDVHSGKIEGISKDLTDVRKELPGIDTMKIDLDHSLLHRGKILVTGTDINLDFGDRLFWHDALNFQITSGERIALEGRNGAGKTTLIKMILGQLQPASGSIISGGISCVYMDQDYSLIDEDLTVFEQTQKFNTGALQEHEIKIRLNRFLFGKADWVKTCRALSGGEKMRLILCSLAIANQAPDLIVLDEPTNNLDIQNVEILTAAINEYQGTLLVVSHDTIFLKDVGVERTISLEI